jgi:hypothetical protein
MAEVNYTLLNKQGKYYITNNENLPITYTLHYTKGCVPETQIGDGSIEVGVPTEIPLTTDGYYRIVLASTEFVNTFSYIYIKYFESLQTSMIEDIYTVLCPCDCGCASCVDLSTDQYQALLTTRNKIDVYKYTTSPQYDAVMQVVHEGTACLIAPQLYCDIATEGVTGQATYNENLTKQLIALDYLAMYYWDLKGITDPEQIAYINDKYKADEILCCISKLGIDINAIKKLIDDMATGTITSAVYTNLGPTDVGFLDIDVANRTVDYPFTIADFTDNVVSYPPAANDPNPDPANNVFYAVRIDSLLAGAPEGMLEFDNIDVIIGQEILMSDIALGKLTYTSPDLDAVDVDTFSYSISNVGAPTIFIS